MPRLSAFFSHRPRQDCFNPFSWRYLLGFLLRSLPFVLLAGTIVWVSVKKAGPYGRQLQQGALPVGAPKPEVSAPTEFQYSDFTVKALYGPVSSDQSLFPIIAETVRASRTRPMSVPSFLLWDNESATPRYFIELPNFTTGETSVLYLPERDEFLISTLRYAALGDAETEAITKPSFETAFDRSSGRRSTTLILIDAATGAYHRQMDLAGNFVPTDYSPELDLVVGVDRRDIFNEKNGVPAVLNLEKTSLETLNVSALERAATHRYENPRFSEAGTVIFDHPGPERCGCNPSEGWHVELDLGSRQVIGGKQVHYTYPNIQALSYLSPLEALGEYRIYSGQFWIDPSTGKRLHGAQFAAQPFAPPYGTPVFTGSTSVDMSTRPQIPGNANAVSPFGTSRTAQTAQITPQPFYEIRRADSGALITSSTLHLQFAGKDHLLIDHGNLWEFQELETYIQENQVAPEFLFPPEPPEPQPFNPLAGGPYIL